MKRIVIAAAAVLSLLALASCSRHEYKYETVKGDPMGTMIYTLDNGLKVYMSVNKEEPTLQTYIAVKAGSKNDPHDNTGLSHYLEHLMFKGTQQFGTQDYEAEKPLLDSITALFEVYRTKTDPVERAAIYHNIDSISYLASKIAIPNEYDKLMSIIGSSGSNAWTSNDETVYQENIPSNQIENWAKIQSDRFMHTVLRGFHTELEAVYEEKNMDLTDDMSKVFEAVDSVLFPNHPYGLQTTLGTQEHLKNPSLIAIDNHRKNFYVPNNVAICVSGDFDPDQFVKIVEKYFGEWEPNPDIKMLEYEEEKDIASPVVKNVYGLDAEYVTVGWRAPGTKDYLRSEVGDIVSSILYNGHAGLMDLDLMQAQKVNSVQAMNYARPDYSEFLLIGYPRQGQSLEEVRELMLSEVAKLRSGDFDEQLIQSTINNIKLSNMRQLESNQSRARAFINSFISEHNWKDDALQIERLEKVTKQQVVDWANQYLGDNSYVVAYKRIGVDRNIEKIAAPKITPIETNRDKQSAFLTEIQNTEVTPIEPVFVNFDTDMSKGEVAGLELLYKKNEINDVAQVSFSYDKGTIADPRLNIALDYIDYLGTPTRSAEEISKEMYSLACNYRISAGASSSTFSVSGLDENIGKAMSIMEDLVMNAQPDEDILAGVKSDIIKNRSDNKLNQRSCFAALRQYLMFGADYVKSTNLTDGQIDSLTSQELLDLVKDLYVKDHKVLYYGPSEEAAAKDLIAANHTVAASPEKLVKMVASPVEVSESAVYIAPYDANNFYYLQYSDRGEKFDVASEPGLALFNNYFGSGMNTIVFQEMREARALAYSASAYLATPSYKDNTYTFYAFIASQNDKLRQAVETFDDIINNMPESEKAFQVAKSGLLSNLRTQRTNGIGVLNEYVALQDLGLKEDRNKLIFEKVQDMTLADMKAVQEKWVKGRTYVYGFLGNSAASNFDLEYVNTLGPVNYVTLEDIFGY